MAARKFKAQHMDRELAFANAWDAFTRSGLAREQPDVRMESFDGQAWHVEFTVYLEDTPAAVPYAPNAYAVFH